MYKNHSKLILIVFTGYDNDTDQEDEEQYHILSSIGICEHQS